MAPFLLWRASLPPPPLHSQILEAADSAVAIAIWSVSDVLTLVMNALLQPAEPHLNSCDITGRHASLL